MALALALLGFLLCNTFLPSSASSDSFLQCLSSMMPSQLVYQQSSSSFISVLESSVQNPKFITNTTVRPLCIITASDVSHVQAAVRCGRWNGVRLRVRSGGHDYEGLSYRSVQPEVFAVLDLAKLIGVHLNPGEGSAWVDAGSTLGELYYTVGTTNPGFLFPAGACATVGVSGFISGGGIGLMMRKYGVGGDNVLDVKIVNANGNVLDRDAMGEDLFWAIRGGGGESFGVVVAWRLKLSKVPPIVTVVNILKTMEQGVADLLAKWETTILSPSLIPDLTIRVVLQERHAFFQTLFLGRCSDLLNTVRNVFPELGMTAADCNEMNWLRAMAFIYFGNTNTPVEALLNRTKNVGNHYFKSKSDYVRRAVGKAGWESLYQQWLSQNGNGQMILEPHGAMVGGANTNTTSPYPHRRGVLFNIQYGSNWCCDANGTMAAAALGWLKGLYGFMEPFVTSNPREAFANYRDLELGQNVVGRDGVSSYWNGRVWAEKYFMGNYRRLAAVKAMVDPSDYFRNEQSIPPLPKS
ncbi:Flavin-dependent oxidoreductase FOX1 [Dichanthelium oligosanthes]|uniref:Flavin-dependent oxidoreductase FOX1 n=1 Tax=Dichanthelium oligosanthes TaxID=888268 RepID=A0A1E5URK0_9POAL|nr:Flavin-dependent oxidoreductase FOX1 [Dichanthelium oligosanthes]